jgi:hypothetical protein
MPDFEKLGSFYLGRPYDLARRQPREGVLLYDSKDLVTHAVCVGMTGSGKTGLCISLLEEAAIDGIPALVIDPKGDLGNLLLTFPELSPEAFLPWVDDGEARRKGLAVPDYARREAEVWARGLAEWGQDGARIRKLRESAEFAIYTPGSRAGLPVAILRSFAAPTPAMLEDADLVRERISTTATSLLGLLGIEADPVRSREHILISQILDTAWRQRRDLDLSALIHQIQTPPVTRIGVLDLEAFYPAKERFALAMSLNNLLAAPGFEAWREGEPLDIGRLLWSPAGKPRVSIFSIAHLGDAERMFFVALLLEETLAWVRTQSGTPSLRALVYMDEIFGYFPPVANPPSKAPLLTLLKQARAFGVGVVLATQNPVDLDYKGLANAGTWFIGRLQTERDKARVLDGLEGASASAGARFDRRQLDSTLSALGSRVFLLNNVHDDAPEVFETRWAMSYLRGPLTREQIKRLMDPVKAARGAAAPAAPAPAAAPGPAAPAAAIPSPAPAATSPTPLGGGAARPVLPPGIPQHFVPARSGHPAGATLRYEPMVLGAGTVRFTEPKLGIDVTEESVYLTVITDQAVPVRWEDAVEAAIDLDALEGSPDEGATYGELPQAAGRPKSYETWRREFTRWLSATERLELLQSPAYRVPSNPGEAERDFRIRLGQLARERRDQWAAELRKKYAPKMAALEERLRRARQAEAREKQQVTQQGLQTAISLGATLLGAFLGRKAVSATTLGRATTAAKSAGRVLKERQDVSRADETVEALEHALADLEAQFKAETDALEARTDPQTEPLETVSLQPKKTNVAVKLVALVWTPHWQAPDGSVTPAWT